jgi:hypothetical protein
LVYTAHLHPQTLSMMPFNDGTSSRATQLPCMDQRRWQPGHECDSAFGLWCRRGPSLFIQTTPSDQLRSIVKKFKDKNRRRNVVGQQWDSAGICSRRAATFNHGPAAITSAIDRVTTIRQLLFPQGTIYAFLCFSGLIFSTFAMVFGNGHLEGTTLLAPSSPDIVIANTSRHK